MRLSQGQIGVISAPICAFYHHSLGGFSIVSVQPCLFFSDSGSKLGQGTTLHKLIEYTLKGAEGKLPAVAVSGPFGTVKGQSSGLYAQKMAEFGFLAIAFDLSNP